MNLQRNTLMFDHCFVCETRFKTSVPPGNANREDHHVFPRNAGGTDGPLVSLCDSHHGTIHKIAERLKRKAAFTDLLESSQLVNKRLCWLAAFIVKAEASVQEGDPNKHYTNSVQLNQQETQMMKKLQSVYPKLKRGDVFRLALAHFYKQHFS